MATRLLSLLLTAGLVAATALPALSRPGPPSRRRTDPHGDPLPAGAVARLGTVRWRAGEEIAALAFSPAGKTLAAASRRGVGLFDTEGKRYREVGPAQARFEGLAFAPDGRRVACKVEILEGRR